MKKSHLLFLGAALSLPFFQSCSTDDPIEVETPNTYSFERDGSSTVSYSGQTQRLNMMDELIAECKSGAEKEVENELLLNMFNNENNPFSNTALNQTGDDRKQIASKLFGQGDGLTVVDGGKTKNFFIFLLSEISNISKSYNKTATNGEAGVIESGTSKYLVNENGLELTQVLEKSLMGALMFHQSTNVYLGAEKLSVDGQNLASEKNYTSLEHHIDEAYGYLELPVNMDIFNTMGENKELRYWAKYVYERTGDIGFDLATELHTSFKNLRACAAAQFDYPEDEINCSFDADIEAIKINWELMIAANVIHYLNSAKSNLTDQGKVSHALSEGIGFLYALGYANNGNGRLNEYWILEIEATIGSSLWEVTPTNLDKVKDKLAEIFPELASVKDQL